MAEFLQLDIVTPERKILSDSAVEISVPGKNGYMDILPGHAPLISELAVGEIMFRNASGKPQHLACAWGFVEVLPDKVTILAETAERPEEIDVDRARKAKERAEQVIKTGSNEEQLAAELDLLRANTRLEVASKSQK
ncbi:MAG: F0F1 ATP synthase subunit epsilon [Acidobacteriales bacterium]|nr:F0F1 ATP synthase subunit epsilon [Terriglobales bacterium]